MDGSPPATHRKRATIIRLSDHYHPWNNRQGQSPFIWIVIGALSQAVSLPVETAVTCPRMRTHPAVIAQVTATSTAQLGGQFRLRGRHRRADARVL